MESVTGTGSPKAAPLLDTESPMLSPEQQELQDAAELQVGLQALVSLMGPVALTMILSALLALGLAANDEFSGRIGISRYAVFNEAAETTSSGKFEAALLNSLIIVGVVLVTTFVIVLLYYFRCTWFLTGYMVFSIWMLIFSVGSVIAQRFFQLREIRTDSISFFFVLGNLASGGAVCVFYYGPQVFKDGYLVIISAMIAWLLSLLPEWTTFVLVSCLALYDICAVLSPCGPLKALIYLAQSRKEAIPALVFEVETNDPAFSREDDENKARDNRKQSDMSQNSHYQRLDEDVKSSEPVLRDNDIVEIDLKDYKEEKDLQSSPPQEGEEDEDRTVKLGLGDFIFYSVLVSRASLFGFITFITSFVGIISGLAVTLGLLAITKRALPALPVSIALGVTFYLITRIVLAPIIAPLAIESIFL